MKTKSRILQIMLIGLAFALGAAEVRAQCDPNSEAGNCVTLARDEVPSLPTGLTYYSAKQNIINHHFPTVGAVAVMPVTGSNSAYGHVAVVKSVTVNSNGTLSLTIDEGNWIHCQVSYGVSVTPESRNIEGYFDPTYPSGQSSPSLTSVSGSTGTRGQQFYVTAGGSGFDSGTAQGIILGGGCSTFGTCTVPNNVITNKSSTSLSIPVTLNSPGVYTLYVFNQASGKTSQGRQIVVQ